MKEIRTLLAGLVLSGLALALVSSVDAQTVNQGVATVIRIKGAARYNVAGVWHPLDKVGVALKPGTLIQTERTKGSYVDIILGEGNAPIPSASASTMAYQPSAEQNVVRIWEDSALKIDKLTSLQTGSDVVTETQLDLQRGRIFGTVKKMSAASKYEVTIPNGVAGIRGTIYELSAVGVIKVLVGSCIMSFVGADGQARTQVVMALQQYDARTGEIIPLPPPLLPGMEHTASECWFGPPGPPRWIFPPPPIFVSPTSGQPPRRPPV